ncbi:ABC transporter permease [Rhodanobacter hydrolyticus]|uniref:ABC transporter permease n=1 Tax=Rhodanobacter hydrolyticus TaxID=2250595 RepID=A0ABW8J9J1_9GAMM
MHPVVSALKYHKTTVVLVALEIALTCAIVTNALFLVGDRMAAMRMTTGVADNELVWARTTGLDLGQGDKPVDDTDADLAALRSIPGVESVTTTNSLPLSRNSWGSGVFRRPGDAKSDLSDPVVQYLGSHDMLKTLGIKLSAGRDFLPQEYVDFNPFKNQPPPSVAIVTHTLAEQLWPRQSPIGKTFWLDSRGKKPVQVVGEIDHLLNPEISKSLGVDRSYILPVTHSDTYVLRVRSDRRGAVKLAIPKVLQGTDPARMVDAHIYSNTVSDYYHGDRAMVWLLLVVTGCLLALTALGVVGLSSFWVQQRTRSIGIRRAIGAQRHDILRYFQFENLLIVSAGIVIGSLGAVGLNLWLMQHYELAHMPLAWLASGAVVLWLLGQLAVLGPALRASHVPPVVATRSV